MGGGIMLCVIGLGTLVMALHGQILHSAPGIGLCTFLSVFWAYRCAVQFFVYAALWPAGQAWTELGSKLLFVSLTGVYALSALLALAA
jgi:hypothetical protein